MPCIQPWTHVLPKVSPMLIHRTAADQLRHLCSPWLAEEALSYLAAQQEGLEAHADELASLGLHRQDFEWAYGIAHSRAGGWNDTQARYDIIIPGVDLVNHDRSPTAQIRWALELCLEPGNLSLCLPGEMMASLHVQAMPRLWHRGAGPSPGHQEQG